MSDEKTPVQELVEEWLSLDKKRNLRDVTYSWLGLTQKGKTSITAEVDKEAICPEEEESVAKP